MKGIVQGVGFRPFVYRLAAKLALSGKVCNTPTGVVIEIEGAPSSIERFLALLQKEAPPLARITEIEASGIPAEHSRSFEIMKSDEREEKETLISPDIAVCDDCLKELFDPSDRRYRYPFINCTNCGPRFTIIRKIPYDRVNTSMSVFTMCPDCRREYNNPMDRRFHAQPNACFQCGPGIWLTDAEGRIVRCDDSIAESARLLKEGKIVAIKGLGGFHLAVDAENDGAVRRLRERKAREEKPLAIMSESLDKIDRYAPIDEEEKKLLCSPERPIVLLRKKDASIPSPKKTSGAFLSESGSSDTESLRSESSSTGAGERRISEEVAPKNTHFGVMLPYTPLHHLLFKSGPDLPALVMTSGNLSEEPIAIGNEEALRRLGGIADYFLMHNREILLRSDDSVILRLSERNRLMRRSRGFVPVPIFLREEYPAVLAYGAELKNTLCLLKGKTAFLSQHVGDLENMEAFDFFIEAGDHLREILEIEPLAIAYDLHPEYLNSKHAMEMKERIRAEREKSKNGKQEEKGKEKEKEERENREGRKGAINREEERERTRGRDLKFMGIQHHHAHIVSCLAENEENRPVIGLAMDGLGYGTDGTLWGGEVLIADHTGFERFMSFKSMPMPGGTAAIKEPWRMAVSFLYSAFGDEFFRLRIPFLQSLDRTSLQTIVRMIQQRINSPLTSGLGRIFDAASALLGIRPKVTFEGQAPFELEMAIDTSGRGYPPYNYSIVPTDRALKYGRMLRTSWMGAMPNRAETRSREEKSSKGGMLPENDVPSENDLPSEEELCSENEHHFENEWFFWCDDFPSFLIDLDETFREMAADIERRRAAGEISARFHNTIISLLAEACSMLRLETGFDRVALSGGVFQNKYLFANLVKELDQRGFDVLTHSLVPANDGGISLGQAIIAASLLKMGKP